MINDSLFERKAALKRAVGSLQILNEEIRKKADESKAYLNAEYFSLDQKARSMTKDYQELPLEVDDLRNILLRMKEIRRCIIGLDETAGGAKYQTEDDQDQSRNSD